MCLEKEVYLEEQGIKEKTIPIKVFNVLIAMGYLQGEERPFQAKAP